MAYVITQPCINTKDTACVEVCPVECIHPGKSEAQYPEVVQLYIDPDACIDCGACQPECPVSAIFPADEVPDDAKKFIEMNADWYKLAAADYAAKWGQPGKA
jgi:ferredoxin